MVSVHGSISDLKALSRLLKTPRRLLWRRWRLPLLLALPAAALLSWLGNTIGPHLGPFATGWRAWVVSVAVVVVWLLSLFVASRRSPRAEAWTRGAYPASDSAEMGWYLAEPLYGSFATWLVVGLTTATAQVWLHAANVGLDPLLAASAWLMLARLIRDLVDPHHSAIGITASGVHHGSELYRWEQIGKLWADDDDHFGFFVDGRSFDLGTPPGRFKSTDVLNVINYYLKRPHEHAGIATANLR